MNERELLLLGLLRREEMHGYQLSQFLDHRLDSILPMKRSTVYFLLKKMAEKGLINQEAERQGQRPERRVYSITREGDAAFIEALRAHLSERHPPQHPDEVGLLLMDMIPIHERAELMRIKFEAIKAERQSAEERLEEHTNSPAYWTMNHRLAHLKAEEEWFQGVLDRLETRAALFPAGVVTRPQEETEGEQR